MQQPQASEELPLAEKGDGEAQVALGALYENGEGGVKQDYAEAAKWYRMAAEQGLFVADFELGELYIHGQGVPRDDAEGAKRIRIGAEAGIPSAKLQMSFLYLNGIGVRQNWQEAYFWHKISHGDTYHPVDFEKLEGHLAIKDDEIAAHLTAEERADADKRVAESYRTLAERGYTPAQAWLGEMYEHGVGVPQDWTEAYFWDSLVAVNRNRTVSSELAKHLTAEQISSVEKRVHEWKPTTVSVGTDRAKNAAREHDGADSSSAPPCDFKPYENLSNLYQGLKSVNLYLDFPQDLQMALECRGHEEKCATDPDTDASWLVTHFKDLSSAYPQALYPDNIDKVTRPLIRDLFAPILPRDRSCKVAEPTMLRPGTLDTYASTVGSPDVLNLTMSVRLLTTTKPHIVILTFMKFRQGRFWPQVLSTAFPFDQTEDETSKNLTYFIRTTVRSSFEPLTAGTP